jgi:hypothetical protein
MEATGIVTRGESASVHNGHGIAGRRFAGFETVAQIDVLQS